MTPSAWLQYVTGRLGPLPQSYLAFDVETSGLSPKEDVVLQIGWAMVEDRKLVDRGAVVVDWTRRNGDGWVEWLSQRIDRTRQNIECDRGGYASGNTWNFSVARLRAEGCDPLIAFDQFRRLADDCRAGGFAFVGHYGLRCDQPMLDRSCVEVLGPDRGFQLAPNEYHDTMALEKGVQLCPAVQPGETWAAFIRRAYTLGGNKVKASLDRHCAGKYDLHNKHQLDMGQAHEAEFDAVLTHLLFEEFRAIMGGESAAA